MAGRCEGPLRARRRQRDREAVAAGEFLDQLAAVRQSAGFEGVTSHHLRHGAATLLLAAGVPDTVTLEVMGHADTRILRHYQEVVDELKRHAAQRMDGLLGAGPL